MRTRAQVRCNRGVWVRVRASILAQAQVRTTERARVQARACVQVGSGANVAQSNRGGTSHNFRLPHLRACVRPCAGGGVH